MKARINRLTIRSENNYALGRFYEGVFRMRPTGPGGATEAVRLGDGYVELTIEPRLPGLPAQLDHFGIEVDDLELARARIGENFPAVAWQAPPAGAAAASFSTHDPDGNVFDVVQAGGGGATAPTGARERAIDHFALRVVHPETVAAFYAKVFDLTPIDKPSNEQKNFYLSDGRVTLVIIPWRINDFLDTGISARGMDHIGFKVESIAALKTEIDRITEKNYRFQPRTSVVGRGKEGANRLAMFRKTCPLGRHHMADSDGFLIDVVE